MTVSKGPADGPAVPKRQAISPLMYAGLSFWLSCAAMYTVLRQCEPTSYFTVFACAFACGACGLLIAVASRATTSGLVVVAMGCGAVVAVSGAISLSAASGQVEDGMVVKARFTMLEDMKPGSYGASGLALMDVSGMQPAKVKLNVKGGDMLLYGEMEEGHARLKSIDHAADARSWSSGYACQATLIDASPAEPGFPVAGLIELRKTALSALGGESEANAFLQAVVCGYRANLSESGCYEAFKTCGIAHLVAVSGAHLVIVTSLFASVMRAARLPRKFAVVLLTALMLGYLVFSGAPLSAIRATIMSSSGLLALYGRRRPSSGNALGLCLIVLIATDPVASVSVSLALSALSTLGIVLFSPLISYWLSKSPIGRFPFIVEPVALTLSSMLATQLLSCALFSRLPIVSVLANVACAPLFPLACATGLLAALTGCIGVPGAGLLLIAAEACSDALLCIAGLFAGMPYASVPLSIEVVPALVATAVFCIVVWGLWSRLRLVALASVVILGAFAFLFVPAVLPVRDQVVMLDVGQGDAFLLRSGTSSMLVDTGNQDSKLLSELAKQHVAHLDTVLITHADDDHCGSLDALEQSVDVERVIVARDALQCNASSCRNLVEQASRTAREVVGVGEADTFTCGNFSVKVLWPYSYTDDGGNADSIVMLVEDDSNGDGDEDWRALFTGDAESDQLGRVLDKRSLGEVDVLKVGHHGSRDAVDEDILEIIRPSIALIGVGANNRYGHPASETLDLLEASGAKVFRTDEDGSVTCFVEPSGTMVQS